MHRIGLIPAAGKAKRLPFLPCSKEIFPIGIMERIIDGTRVTIPKPIISYLIEQMIAANIKEIIIVVSDDKTDILRLLGEGKDYGVNITYQIQEDKRGMPFALNLAYPWTKESVVFFGMPDTIFSPPGAYNLLLEKFIKTNADITLGLFPTSKPQKFGMVSFEIESGDFIYTIDKPDQSDLEFMWGIACWGPRFSELLLENVNTHSSDTELVFGTVIQNAHNNGLKVNIVPFQDGEYIDIGTPDDLLNAMIHFYPHQNRKIRK